jgi:hypothetical protein
MVGAAAAVVLTGCATASSSRQTTSAAESLPAYSDGTEYFVPTSRLRATPTAGVTYYFQTNTKRICYAFHVPGTWELGRQQAMLRRVDGGALVGVLLLGVRELGAASVEDGIRKAAERSGQTYATNLGPVPWTLAPYARVPGAWVWSIPVDLVPREHPDSVVRMMPRWFVPVGHEWIGQFSIGAPSDVDRDAFVEDVIRSLTITREARCYQDRLRELGGIRAR